MSIKSKIEGDWVFIPTGNNPLIASDQIIVVKNGAHVFSHSFADIKKFTNLQNTVFVTSRDQLEGIDSTKNYMIDGVVDMGDMPIIVPPTGLSISGLNGARDTARLISSSDNYTMFLTPDGDVSGDVVMESMTVEVTGAGSKVFGLDNGGNSAAIDIIGVNFISCTSLGDLSDYRQFFITGSGLIAVQDGLSFSGAWTGLAATDTIAIAFPAAALFKAGLGLTFSGSVRTNMNFLNTNASAVFMDFSEANILSDEGLALDGFRTAAINAMPNLPASSRKARFSNCRGVRNTYVGGQWTLTSPAATTIGNIDTLVKVAGVTTYSDLQWFESGGNNALTYLSEQPIEVEVKCVVTATGTNGDQVEIWIRKWDDSASSYVNISSSGSATMNASGRAEGIALFGYAMLSQNDRLELWVENNSGPRNVTIQSGGLFGASER